MENFSQKSTYKKIKKVEMLVKSRSFGQQSDLRSRVGNGTARRNRKI